MRKDTQVFGKFLTISDESGILVSKKGPVGVNSRAVVGPDVVTACIAGGVIQLPLSAPTLVVARD
jgi:hypothetical protein